jgi:hypothetical protein
MAVVSTDTNLSAVSYTAGETITIQGGATLTMDADPTTRPGIIQCTRSGKFRIENTSTTTPIVLESNSYLSDLRFEGNGVLEVRGDMIDIWTSDGTYHSWDFTSLFSGKLTDITHVEVETSPGSGDYMPWAISEVTSSTYHANRNNYFSGSVEKTRYDANQEILFWDSLTKILDTGDGTNGKMIPNGCKVRIPNVLITNQYHYSDASAHRHYIKSGGVPTGGTFTITITDRRTNTVIGTTTALAYNASLAAVDAALEVVLGIPITTSGSGLPTAIAITQAGAWATIPLAFTVTSSVTGGTNSLVYSEQYSVTDSQLLDLSASGALDVECCMFSRQIYTVNTAFSKFRAVHTGMGNGSLGLTSSNGTIELDHFSFVPSAYTLGSANSISNVSGTIIMNKCAFNSIQVNALAIATLPNITRMDDIMCTSWGVRQSTSYNGATFATVSGLTVNNMTVANGKFMLTDCRDIEFIGLKQSDATTTTQLTTSAVNALSFINTSDVIVSNFEKYGTSACRLTVFATDASSENITIIGGSYDCADNSVGLVTPGSSNLKIIDFQASNIRTGPIIDLPTSFTSADTKIYKTLMTQSTGTDGIVDTGQNNIYDVVSGTVLAYNTVNAAVENFVGANLVEPSLTPTTGNVIFGGFGRGTSLAVTGGTYTDQIGSIYLPADGDTAIVTMPFSMHTITSFQNQAALLQGEALDGKANAWRVMNDGGVTGGTFAISIYDSSGALVGTTTNIAFSATLTTVDNALGVVTGSTGNHIVSGTLTAGYIITFLTTYGDGVYTLTVDGSLLTGGTKPNTAEARAIPNRVVKEEFGAGLTVEYQVKNPADSYGATWYTVNGANLSSAISGLTAYDKDTGLDMRLRFTAVGDDDYRRVQLVSMATNVDVTTWNPPDSTIQFHGVNPTDEIHICDITDDTELYVLTGTGVKDFYVGDNYGKDVYFIRNNSSGRILMTTYPDTVTLKYGDNGSVDLYYGSEVQLANASDYVTAPDFPNYLDLGGILKPL